MTIWIPTFSGWQVTK